MGLEIEKRNGIYYSRHGLELIARRPDFIEDVWRNYDKRKPWFVKGQKSFLKVIDNDTTYVEKAELNEGETNMRRLLAMQVFLDKRGYKNLRSARSYFATDNSVLLEFVPGAFELTQIAQHSHRMNDGAHDELWKLMMRSISFDLGITDTGDGVIIDPHCSIDPDCI